MGISRRTALKTMLTALSTAAAGAVRPCAATASNAEAASENLGMLYDSTRCIGCKACMVACNQANDLPPDTAMSGGIWQMPLDLNEQTKNIIKLYRDDDSGEWSFVKRQCMHCVEPACVSACMIGALDKREFGIVTYDPSLCIGCRYCEMACPFNVPKFEWAKAMPKIVKCELCNHRIAVGKGPACCEVCPTGAVVYGKRGELLEEAHRRIERKPDLYLDKVYGEHDAGGTQVLYLSHVAFDKLGLPNCGDQPVAHAVLSVQHAVYRGFAAPVALYGILAALVLRNWRGFQPPPQEGEEDET